MAHTEDGRVTDRAHVANDGAQALTLIIHPWAIERVLAPDGELIVEAEGPAGPHAELLVERTCDTAVVWTWPGATARLLTPDGRVVVDWAGMPGSRA